MATGLLSGKHVYTPVCMCEASRSDYDCRGLRVYPGNTSMPITNTLNLWSVQAGEHGIP